MLILGLVNHIAKSVIFEKNRLTIGVYSNAIEKFYAPIANRILPYEIAEYCNNDP